MENYNEFPKTVVTKNTLCDTRTSIKLATKEEFEQSNKMHIEDVKNVMDAIATTIKARAKAHDYTKISLLDMEYNDYKETMTLHKDFTHGPWRSTHIAVERHHINAHCPDDVNLVDVIEMIADCVTAGSARSGSKDGIYPITLSNEILQKALKNTVEMVKDSVEIKDNNEEDE